LGRHVASSLGLLVLISGIHAILDVVRSTASSLVRVIWIALILVVPFLGFILCMFPGPREERSLFRR
jgi:Phospholipase_D-nuclease N-terminal